ncbi:Outer membrane protein assembly factor BamA precursor [Novipirellula galeiformis]|uniref:Outer membrane protein assembly factor BamA n=2 Tax=Novipirellula galeiformis TaxID=2528004 RepID=A0A5C6CRM3_9BACT|nr:Outer membrane protein assembly factor BamA precursor [Novipirellula galeiformis]
MTARTPRRTLCCSAVCAISMAILIPVALTVSPANAQMGGGGGFGGGQGGPSAPAPDTKPKFRDHVRSRDGLAIRREKGDAIVLDVSVRGNQAIGTHLILQKIETRKDRFYDYETVLGDVRRLNDMGSFDHVTFKLDERPEGVAVTYFVHERPVITKVVFHGHRALNNREIRNRAGVQANDPLSEFSIESARRRMIDYYHEEGFNQVAVDVQIGYETDPGVVIFRINEGPKERIADIVIKGNTIVTEARLKKIITSRGPTAGILSYIGNTADLAKIDNDVNVLATYYHNLGFLTATVGRRLSYDESGKWMTVTFVVNEGPRFKVNDIKIVGNQFITEESLRQRLSLKAGDMFDGTLMRRDIGEITYGYGELGFIYAEVEPKTVMRDEANVVDLVYEVTEGDIWKVGRILVNIEGEPHLMRESTMLNMVDLREGDVIDRRSLELNRRRIERSQLLETNPQIADAPDIKVVPTEGEVGDAY